MSRHTLTQLRQMKASGEKIAVLTSYDASFSKILEEAGVDIIFIDTAHGHSSFVLESFKKIK